MPSMLRDLQRDFVGALREKTACENRFLRELQTDKRADAELRLGIYAYAYQARLHDALTDDFQTVKTLMTNAEFSKTATQYLSTQKNRHFNLNEYGRDFLKWIGREKRIHRSIKDAAQLDWFTVESFYAKSSRVSTKANVKRIKLQLANHVRLMHSKWPIDALWNGKIKRIQKSKASYMVVYRKAGLVKVKSLNKTEYDILCKIEKRQTLEQVAQSLLKNKNIQLQMITKFFAETKALGIFT